MPFRSYLVLIAALTASITFASSELKAVKIAKPPVIDGIVSADEWKDIPSVEGLYDNTTGAAYSDGGKFWLAYDKDFVYFAAQLQEKDLHAIRATEYRTNVSLTGDDYVELDLDLSGSLSSFNTFQINPQGATNINIAGGRAAKREWLGEFLAKSRITGTGWEVEARIPWSGMSIPRGGSRNVRFNIQRYVAHSQRTLSYTYVPFTQTALTPTWVGVELPSPPVDRSIRLLPYAYAGYDPKIKGVFNSGVDIKTALSDQINLVGSINPDFRNIENQILSIDFSRFERLAGETRPFFQEGRQFSNSTIFASQRIGGFDFGLNTYGRVTDKMSFSLIDATRFGHENDAIFNVTEDPNPNTSIRATVTELERNGISNQAYLIRLSQNIGAYNIFVRNMGSQDTKSGFGMQSDLMLNYSKAGFSAGGGYLRADPGFRPRLGFVPEVDLEGPFYNLDFSRNYNYGGISDTDFGFGQATLNHTDGSFYRNESAANASVTFRPGINFFARADLADFEGSHDSLYTLIASYPNGNPYNNLGIHYDFGNQAGLPYRSLAVATAYRVTKKLQLRLRHQHVDYAGPNDQTILSLSYDLGNDRAISGRLVRQSGHTNAYVAYQRSGNKGIEYFLILGDPNAESFRTSLILKVTVPFRLG